MQLNWAVFYTWFASISSAALINVIESEYLRWTKYYEKDREKRKDIKNGGKEVYLEGMGNGFCQLPPDFRSLIYDAENLGYRELSNKLSDFRFAWTYASLRYNPTLAQEAHILPNDLEFFEQNRRLAVKLANEIKEALCRL